MHGCVPPLLRDPFRHETREVDATAWLAKFFHGFGLDLSDPLAGDLKDRANLLERVGAPVGEAKPQANDFSLAVGEPLEGAADG